MLRERPTVHLSADFVSNLEYHGHGSGKGAGLKPLVKRSKCRTPQSFQIVCTKLAGMGNNRMRQAEPGVLDGRRIYGVSPARPSLIKPPALAL